MDVLKIFLSKYFFRLYGVGMVLAAAFLVHGFVGLTSETSNFISIQIGVFLFWCVGNLKFSFNVLFYDGFWKKFWLFIMIWFNLLTLAWILEFLTDFKIMGMIMGMS